MQPFETTPSATPLKLQPFAPMPPPSNAANDTSSMFADYQKVNKFFDKDKFLNWFDKNVYKGVLNG